MLLPEQNDRGTAPDAPPSALVTLMATGLGSGLLPKAPGTWGSLLAVFLAWPLALAWGWVGLLAGGALVFLIGIPVSDAYVRRTGREDPGEVVIDEVAGQWLTLIPAALEPTVIGFALGFVLFRIFDVLKPWPIRAIERNSKGGFGIMIDDVAAAVPAALLLYGVTRLMGH